MHYQLIELTSIGTRENVEVANINSFDVFLYCLPAGGLFSCLCLCLVKVIVGKNVY